MFTGLGNLPRQPRLRLLLRIIAITNFICFVTLIYLCALSNKCKLCIGTKIEVKKCQEETKQVQIVKDQ